MITVTLDNVHALLARLGCRGSRKDMAHGWTRVYIETGKPGEVPLSHGRIMFRHGVFSHVKWYGDSGFSARRVYDTDRLWYAWEFLLDTNEVMTGREWLALLEETKIATRNLYDERLRARAALDAARPLPMKWDKKRDCMVRRKRRKIEYPSEAEQAHRILERMIAERVRTSKQT